MQFSILALAVAAFGIGTTEFMPMGLLPVIAADLGVSIPKAGMLVSAYATGVLIGAPVMTLSLGMLRRKIALLILMVIFTVGNLLSAVADDYTTLLVTRIITSFAHGAFFGLGAVVAASLVDPLRQASAVASMFMGLTIANLAGVPVATWIGHEMGWRAAFAATAIIGVVSLVTLWMALPRGESGKKLEVRKEVRVLVRPPVLVALLTTVLGSAGTFTFFTYFAPILQEQVQATEQLVTIMLIVVGVGFTLGNIASGRAANHSIRKTLLVCFALFALVMGIFPWIAVNTVVTAVVLLVWGMLSFALVAPVQMQVMKVAHDAPGLASSINIGAFNFGNAIGAVAGGGVLTAGWGYSAIPVAGAVFCVAGLALVWLFSKE